MFLSFTEVPEGRRRAYDEWHALDHMPEQHLIEGVAGSSRFVVPSDLSSTVAATDEGLARAQHFHYYLLSGDLDPVLRDLGLVKRRLDGLGRWFFQRHGHLNAPFAVVKRYAAPRVLVDPAVVPFRPATGCVVQLAVPAPDVDEEVLFQLRRWYDQVHIPAVLERPGVAGCWTLQIVPDRAPSPDRQQLTARIYWLDGDPAVVAASTALPDDEPSLAAEVPVFSAAYRLATPGDDHAPGTAPRD